MSSAAFSQNRQRVGMAFVHFGQCQVAAGNARQGLPTLQGMPLARQREQVEMVRQQRLHQLRKLGVQAQRLRALAERTQQAVEGVQVKILNDAHVIPICLRMRAVIDCRVLPMSAHGSSTSAKRSCRLPMCHWLAPLSWPSSSRQTGTDTGRPSRARRE
ncbi:hypothetical protein D3C80_1729460 [compost metagenome]